MGLFVSVSVDGDATDLSIHAQLHACVGESCDADVAGAGIFLAGLGFPFPLLEFDDLAFRDSCPASKTEKLILYGAIGGGVALLALAGLACARRRKTTQTALLSSDGGASQRGNQGVAMGNHSSKQAGAATNVRIVTGNEVVVATGDGNGI